ncbi:hypothetical protein [Algoriphagus limi]|uniref:Cthe-2314-like HEPN domain-containing protein n=1 Tax=Algoriphagus limi TaxID=2975273 RepID=A0ABT2G255_9BACT|nr:hypothetical protein [Algoriphagus limi]MCS5488888.1 hypothetical protein [Algoriphagus limi]
MEKKKLTALLNLISELSELPENEWFKNQLIKQFSTHSENVSENHSSYSNPINLDQKVNLIRKYLAIDLQNLIDYSGFEEPSKEQLFRDCLEMCRFEKGTPNHKKDFGEFCRYAHLQAEEMINFFFIKASGSKISLLDKYLKENLSNYNPSKTPKSIFHINYSYKLQALKGLLQISKRYIDHLFFLNDFRNELSHRNSLSKQDDDKTLIEYQKLGFNDSFPDIRNLNGYEKGILNKGNFIISKRKEEFHKVYETLEGLKENILEGINKGLKLQLNSNSLGNINPSLDKLREKFQ